MMKYAGWEEDKDERENIKKGRMEEKDEYEEILKKWRKTRMEKRKR